MTVELFPIAELADKGLLLQAALPLATLSTELAKPLALTPSESGQFQTLVLMGQAGTRLFNQVVSAHLSDPDPFDVESVRLVEDWFAVNAPAARFRVVFPGQGVMNLGQLAELCGWGGASPLGISIHPDYGLWTAHRVAFLTDIAWDHVDPQREHPCETCVLKPCESACPVGAVSVSHGFNLGACATHRAPEGSECEYKCLARNACPVGAENRYESTQMKHHYASGLKSIREWLS